MMSLIGALIENVVTSSQSFSQPVCTPPIDRTWFQVTLTETGTTDSLWFGFDSTATYGIDQHLCEFELPFETARHSTPLWFGFVNIPGHEGATAPEGLGNGVFNDYRQFLNFTQIDTHLISFGASFRTDWIFRWPVIHVSQLYDSVRLTDRFGGILYNVSMNTVDSLRVPYNSLSELLLVCYGPRSTIVNHESDEIHSPLQPWLGQNYPNPFNPSTVIGYQLSVNSWVTLKIYDLLGREVATLVDRQQPSGNYSVQWQSESASGGIYFYRMNAGSFAETKKLMLMK